jgi:hypothetical protein
VTQLTVLRADFVLNEREVQRGHEVAQAEHDQDQTTQRVAHQPNCG